jgi:serine palmitoyltransferase
MLGDLSKFYLGFAGLSDVPGLVISSHPLSPIVFLKLKISTGSFKGDLQLLEDIVERVR